MEIVRPECAVVVGLLVVVVFSGGTTTASATTAATTGGGGGWGRASDAFVGLSVEILLVTLNLRIFSGGSGCTDEAVPVVPVVAVLCALLIISCSLYSCSD